MRQFSIRDMLLAFVIVALVLGWWFDRRLVPARYEMHVTTNQAFVLDTVTGQVWASRITDQGFLDGSQVLTRAKLGE